jgi:hypothetical protein
MQIIRKYKRLSWFDFLDQIEKELKDNPDKSVYFEIGGELKMRLVESVSEGAAFKMKAPSKNMLEKFEQRMKDQTSFASEQDYQDFKDLVSEVLDSY